MMALKRVVFVLGGLAIAAGAVLMWRPGVDLRAQGTGASTTATTHSIKVTLAPSAAGEKNCRLGTLVPQEAGVYASDTVTFNVENACETDATVSISDFTVVPPATGTARLFRETEKWPRDIPVPGRGRRHIDTGVIREALGADYCFEYRVTLKGPPAPGVPGLSGRACLCRIPPCPPTMAK
jgi:hypothetical protein